MYARENYDNSAIFFPVGVAISVPSLPTAVPKTRRMSRFSVRCVGHNSPFHRCPLFHNTRIISVAASRKDDTPATRFETHSMVARLLDTTTLIYNSDVRRTFDFSTEIP